MSRRSAARPALDRPDCWRGVRRPARRRRSVARQPCRQAACLVEPDGFQYAHLVNISTEGACFVTDGEARGGDELHVLFEVTGGQLVMASFRPLWRHGDRMGGRWREPLPTYLRDYLRDAEAR